MLNLLKMLRYPMVGLVGDDDGGGTNETVVEENADTNSEPKPEPEVTDEGSAPTTPPAENEDEKPEISDDEFANLKELLSPEQFESIQQTRAMNKRMRDKMDKLMKERQTPPKPAPLPKQEERKDITQQNGADFNRIEWFSKKPMGLNVINRWRKMGMDDDDITCQIDAMGIMAQEISMANVNPVAKRFQENDFKEALDSFSNDDKYKFGMSKPEIKKAVESYVRQNYQPEDWNKAETIKTAYGITLAEHPEVFSSTSKRDIVDDGGIHEKGVGGSTGSTGGVSNSALDTFSKERGLGDIKDPVVRKKVLESYNAFKKYEAMRNK